MPNPATLQPDFDRFAQRVDELRANLAIADPLELATHTAAHYQAGEAGVGEFHLPLWERPVKLAFPAFTACSLSNGETLASFHLAMLLYYFSTADGTPLSGNWIAFSDLPDGRFYARAFQSYTGQELARAFQGDQERFVRAAQNLGGQHYALGNASFSFQALPRVPLLAVFWQGDEDFPASFQVLFDACASHYLPTDAYAILGSTLTRRLIGAAP